MNNVSEIDQQDLLNDIISNRIDWREALNIISSQKKPWNTKEWKEKRKARLATRCKKCGSSTPPLVLQHTWHPVPISQLFYQARNEYLNEWLLWKQSHPIEIDTSSATPNADGCPKCGSTTIRYRKRANTWICVSKPGGVFCNNVFETPIRVISNETIRELEKAARQKIQDDFDNEFGIGKKVVITAIEQHIRYISLKDTKTLCKKCAFVEDKTDMVLCKVCRKNYHHKKYDKCSSCAGIDTTESQEFYNFVKERRQWVKQAEKLYNTGKKRVDD